MEGTPNLLSLAMVRDMADDMTWEKAEDVFHVSIKGGQYDFVRRGDGVNGKLYTCDLSDSADWGPGNTREEAAWASLEPSLDSEVQALAPGVETVEGNERLYTKKQVAGAKRASDFIAAMGFQSTKNIIEMVRSGRVQGLDIDVEDVLRSQEIYGPALQAVRGKSIRIKRRRVASKAAGKVVDSNLEMHVDVGFIGGLAFLVAYFSPVALLFVDYIKSRSASDVRASIERQRARVTSEGYSVIEVTSDTEGALVSYQQELEALGCRVSIHPPNTDSAEVDVKIRQLKNGVRACTVLPYLLPIAILMYAVFFACSKINLVPSSTAAHNYSPMETFLGRSVSLERDLGARRGGGKPLAFGSRVEVFEGTTNTLADRTRPLLSGSGRSAMGMGVGYSSCWTRRR